MENLEEKIIIAGINGGKLRFIEQHINNSFSRMSTHSVDDEPEAIFLTEKYNPEVVIIGFDSPAIDPIEFCKKVKNDKTICDVPVILVIPSDDNHDLRQKAYQCGVDAFLYSPIDEIDLSLQLKNLLKIKKSSEYKKRSIQEIETLTKKSRKDEKDPDIDIHKHLTDISDEIKKREKIDVAYLESEEKFRSYTINSPIAIYVTDKHGLCTYVNDKWLELAGMEFEEALGDGWRKALHPDDKDIGEKWYESVKSDGNWTFEYRFVDKRGNVSWVLGTAKPLYDNHKNIYGYLGSNVDVTERKKTEEALKESEERFKNMFEYHEAAMLLIEPDTGSIFKANDSAAKFYGFTKAELCSMYISQINILSPEQVKDEREKAAHNNQNFFIFPHKLATGEIRTVEVHSSPIDFQGKRVLFSIMHDITEREKTGKALKQSEIKYRNLIETIQEGIWQIDKAGHTTFVNKKMADILGYSPEEMMGRHLFSFMNEHGKSLATALLENRRKGIKEQHDFEFIKKNGERTYLLLETVSLTDDDGNYAGSLAAAMDISERKEAERELQDSKKLLSQAEEVANIGSWRWDAEKDIAYWSDGLFKIFKRSPKEGAPKLAEQSALYSHESYENLKKVVNKCFKNGESYEIEVQAIRSDGEIRTCISKGKAIRNPEGKINQLWGTFNDITERKRAETALRDIELARQSIKFKQNFLANMSHEIRTPLTGVMGMIDALEGTDLSDEQKDFISTIKLSGENLQEIIDQVLDFSKIEAGKVTLKPITFEFRSIPETTKLLFTHNLKTGVQLSLKIDDKIPPFIYADKSRLSEIVNNLVSNAVKFTTQGSIQIRAYLLDDKSKKSGVKIKFEVDDTGPGITPEMESKLFIPFSQAEDADIVYHEGTGLGLSICKELVKMMNGEIGMTRKSSKGSIFWFTFKADKAQVVAQKKSTPSKIGKPKKARILLAEDKTVNQKVVMLMLGGMGHTVSIANNGQEALEMYQPGKFDLILMDIQMPVMNGVTATQILKEKYSDLVPVVGLSANAFEGDREKYMAMGMDEYLTKPLNKNELENMINKIMQ